MNRQKDFTYDPVNFKGLPEFVSSIKKDGLRYIIILVSVLNKFYPKEVNLSRSTVLDKSSLNAYYKSKYSS